MDFKVIWSEAATHDLREIVDYISADNPQAAQKLAAKIFKHTRLLSTFPEIGPGYSKSKGKEIRQIVCGKYRIFYQISHKARTVDIIRVWHGARNEPDLGRQE